MLGHAAFSPHERAIRWRQLVELVARAPSDGNRDLFGEALEAIRNDRDQIDDRVRSAAALAVTAFPAPAELVAIFAADRLAVAAPVLAAASLTASEWKQVTAAASEECRSFIVAIRSETPAAAPFRGGGSEREPSREEAPSIPSIGEVVARMERIRHAREGSPASPSPSTGGQSPGLFRWECNEAGQIDWVEGAPRGALVGQSIAQHGNGHGVSAAVERAFAVRAPFHEGLLVLPEDVAVGGAWKISGIPAFDPGSGRFAGYRGVAARADMSDSIPAEAGIPDSDSLRELAHEIRTPLNAIIGFAEMITGEYLGPADGEFRKRADDIVAQARLLVEAVDDLDFAARTAAVPIANETRIHLGELLEAMAPSLRASAAVKGARLDASRSMGDLTIIIDPELAQRLVSRLCTAVIECASQGETLRLAVDCDDDTCRVSVSRPASLAGKSEEELFGMSEGASSQAFSLKLVRGLANIAGAAFEATPEAIALAFPRG